MLRRALGSAVVLVASTAGALGVWGPSRTTEGGLKLPGTVEVQEVRLGSKLGGRVAEVTVAEGALADPGRPLVRLDAPEQRMRLDQARARLEAAEAALREAEAGPRPEER